MATLYARALTYAPPSVPSHQWDVRSVLEIHVEKQCIGWAPSRRRKCTCVISYRNWESFESLTQEIGEQPPDAEQLRPQLERLAYLGLCVRFHRGKQVASMVEKWILNIVAAAATTSTFTPDSPLTPWLTSRKPSQRTQAIPTATPNSASSSERIHPVTTVTAAPATPSGLPSPRQTLPLGPAYSSRTLPSHTGHMPLPVPRATMAALYEPDESLLQAALELLTAVETLCANRRLAPTSTSTPDSLLTPHSPSLESSQRTEPTPTSSNLVTASRLPSDPVSSTGGQAVSGPTLPSPRATPPSGVASPKTRCTRSHARRRSLSDECPICYEGGPLSALPASALTWCTSSCDRAVHTKCFTDWEEQSVLSDWDLKCPVCRADWKESCACGGRSTCDAASSQEDEHQNQLL
ncbi:hypothetical protein B5807_02319 [Epicoccum nigrum]|uniref:RING-type domain-containing protein n=1 Tax=Epicoccum nigrum TaxID=105696 RepID=A0A1Y2M9X0_EPING|nr:hypothetical protein B5807_02319 [Epicoccum nigrum]